MIKRTEQEIMKSWKGDTYVPAISIICITYNHEKYIDEAIDSFLMQETDFPFEIVVGEDFSSDATLLILLEYKKKYPNILKLLINDKNIGVTKNILRTALESNGDFIALCEGDDYWTDKTKLQNQYNILKSDITISGVYHNVNVINENNSIVKNIPFKGKDYDSLNTFFADFYQIPTCSVVFRNFFKDEGFYKFRKMFRETKYILDYLIDTLIIEHGRYIFLDKTMGCYRVIESNSSFSSQKIEAVEKEMLQTRDNIDNYFNFKYHEELLKNKEKIKMSILVKTYKQGGLLSLVRKLKRMRIKEFKSLALNILRYKTLKVSK
jgi:glycosyltransferase involved in cell wall biosynthesis